MRQSFISSSLLCVALALGGIWSAGSAAGGQVQALAPGGDLFAEGAVCPLRIDLGVEALASLRQNPRKDVEATVRDQGAAYERVALHLKGAVGSFRPVDERPGMTLDFCQFKAGRRFHGLRKIYLNNSVEDPSYLNELLGSELFRAAGVPAPRVAHARVVLNGRDLGLYVLKEGFTEDFLAGHFKRLSAALFEPEDGHDIDKRLKRVSVLASSGDRGALSELAEAAKEADLKQRWQRLDRVLDLDRFVAFMAIEVMLGHRDGYCLARNNYRVYHDLDCGKILFFPHGMDQLLGNAELPWHPNLAGLVAKAVIETKEGRERYDARFVSLFKSLFRSEALTNRVEQLVTALKPCLSGSEWSAIREAADQLKERIILREIGIAKQLSRPPLKLIEFGQEPRQPIGGWEVVETPVNGRMDEVQAPEHGKALHIVAGGDTLASWRAKARLPGGVYRFEGRARVAGVKPLGRGSYQGAALRVSGKPRPPRGLTGDSSWQNLAVEFRVEQAGETVEFVCELRARAGEAWFESDSLTVEQLKTNEDRQQDGVHAH